MDYSNFIKNFYRHSINELKKFQNYYGKIVNINRPLEIPKEFLYKEENESMFLPQFSVNINAPSNYFVDFMDYYVSLMPDLGFVLANKARIKDLYQNAVDLGILDDEQAATDYIKLVVGVGIEALQAQGVLEYGNQEQQYTG